MEYSFGEFLKQKRQEQNLTQQELANLLFVSNSAVSKWEKDVAHPDITLLPKLSTILGVSEHELITASIDKQSRQEKAQAKKWRIFSFSWSLFWYIAYAVALIPCFICNLAINKTLSWFWIVLSSLLLSFTFTNLPKLIKKDKLILLPLSMYLALCILLAVCATYTKGDWFWIASLSVLLGLMIIFVPIYIAKYDVFKKLRPFNDFVSVGVDCIMLNLLLVIINLYTLPQTNWWYLTIALPIVLAVYAIVNIVLCVRFLKINKPLKTGILLFLIDLFVYLPPALIKVKNPAVQKELEDMNIFMANFLNWQTETLENNIHLIIALTLLLLAVIFLTVGLILHYTKNKKA